MLRPIQVAPLSQRRMISPDPLVPNNMTQEQFISNQMAGGNAPMIQPTQQSPVQAPSPTARLSQLGQQGLQTAERFAKSITQSPAVQGLLGGGAQANQGGLLGDVQNQADLQGLFATLQAMGRPVRRGEDRLLGAVEYGRGVQQQARQQGLQDMSTQLQLEKLQRDRQLSEQRRQVLQQMQQGSQGQAAQPLSSFSEYAISQMDDNQRQVASQAERLSNQADQLALVDPDLANDFRDQAATLRENALRGIRTQEDASKLELSESEKFAKRYADPTNEVLRRRNSLVGLLEGGGSVGNYVAFVSALKSVEPNSAVLSSEFESATSLGALTTSIQSALARLDEDEQLPERIRNDLERVVDLMADASLDYYNLGVEDIKDRAGRLNLNPDNIITPVMGLRGGATQSSTQSSGGAADEIISVVGGVPSSARGGR